MKNGANNNQNREDFRDFIELLNKHKVDYCITGAYAVTFYSEPRATRDIDFYIAHTKGNSEKVAAAIREFAGLRIDEGYFDTEKTVILRIGVEPNQIELLNGLTGLKDSEIMKHRIRGKYGDLTAYYIGIDELIKNKEILSKLPRRGRKQGSDSTDYKTLKAAKSKKGK
ncbi:MAG: hypothetical protein A2297_00450 [Elusimicrobia bacterium RIFOXYB2_FULL_48_7]|nr:MAG: hypothetical protein A2297_00450 [Elusimicrobia bacterium RIFOXYB2_FULL_48_7]